MKPRYSFSSRRTGAARDPKNIRKQRPKFPKVAQTVLDSSDIILQILDARFSAETRNIDLEKSIKESNKKMLLPKTQYIKETILMNFDKEICISYTCNPN